MVPPPMTLPISPISSCCASAESERKYIDEANASSDMVIVTERGGRDRAWELLDLQQ